MMQGNKRRTDPLFNLIKSLNKGEKRNFKLYVKRLNDPGNTKFVLLFDVLAAMPLYDESVILKKAPSITKTQLPNLKAHLYKEILLCLRNLQAKKDIDLQLREQLDYAKVLYNKGLYKQSLKILDKAKKLARQYKKDFPFMEALHYEKSTQMQHILKWDEDDQGSPAEDAVKTQESIGNITLLSNLTLRLAGLFLRNGYIRNEKEFRTTTDFFKANLPEVDHDKLDFNEKLYLYRCYVWYYYITQDFLMCYRYSQKWVDLFEDDHLKRIRPVAYLKGLNSLLSSLFMINHYERFSTVLKQLEYFAEHIDYSKERNVEILIFNFLSRHRINGHFMKGTFTEGTRLVKDIVADLNEYRHQMDPYAIIILNYKLACLYFGDQNYEKASLFLEEIITDRDSKVGEDIQGFARILNLISYYEAGKDEGVERGIRSTYRYLIRVKDMNSFQKVIMKFLRRLSDIYPQDLRKEWISLKDQLIEAGKSPYERRPFLYFDIISWLESKIENRPVQEIINTRGLSLSRPEFRSAVNI